MQPICAANSATDKRRHTHNICERKRREHIKEGFEELQKRLPKKPTGFKMSKLDILKTSITFISDLAATTDSLESEVCQHLTRYAKMSSHGGSPSGPKISEEELENLVSDLNPIRLLAVSKDMSATSSPAPSSKLSPLVPATVVPLPNAPADGSQASLKNLVS